MKTELLSASDELMTAVFNGAYQGAILTLLVYLVLRLIGPTNAATRYSVWGATLALVIGVIPAHYFRNRFFPDLPALASAAPKTTPFLNTSPARLPDALAPEFLNIEQAPFVEWELVPNQEIGPLSEFDTDAGTSLDVPSSAIVETAARSGFVRNEANETLGAGARPNASVETGPGNLSARQETPSSAGWNLERMLNPISWNITSLAGFPRSGVSCFSLPG